MHATRSLLSLLLCAAVFAPLACSCSDGTTPAHASPSSNAPPRLAMVPKGTTHVFWKAVEDGARVGATASAIELTWKGALKEDDRAAQIQVVQNFVTERVAGIALAPLDHRALLPVVREARAAGIEVVIFDSALDGDVGKDFASYVATDNRAAGALAGVELARLLPAAGSAVLLRYQVGSASTHEREEGFLAAARAAGVKIAIDNRYAGASAGEAKTEALNLADALRAAGGVFCSNESATNGMLLALRQLGLAGKIRFVGFDASPPLVEALERGEIDALVVQDPRKMGELAVRTLAARVRGEAVPPSIDTGAVLATRANMADPAIAPLLR
ncbi:MAG: sugar ABC transporter substrate-binding protein [Planctomycetota bacterium]|nr:MAG: sugar ABC transporter substrate-binding protein [Planctomycetota bacterium]